MKKMLERLMWWKSKSCPECARHRASLVRMGRPEVEIIIHGHVQYKNKIKYFVAYESIIDKTKSVQERVSSIFHNASVQVALCFEEK